MALGILGGTGEMQGWGGGVTHHGWSSISNRCMRGIQGALEEELEAIFASRAGALSGGGDSAEGGNGGCRARMGGRKKLCWSGRHSIVLVNSQCEVEK